MKIKLGAFSFLLLALGVYLLFFQNSPSDPDINVSNINDLKSSVTNEVQSVAIVVKSEIKIGEKNTEDIYPNTEQTNEHEQGLDRFEAIFKGIEKQWSKEIVDLFLGELELDQSHLDKYFRLKEEYENDRLEMFESYHEKMIAEHGDDYVFHLTDQDTTPELQDLNINYRDKLREVIGDDNYTRYLQLKDSFNEKIKTQDHIDYRGMEIYF